MEEPTHKDAELIIELTKLGSTPEAREAMAWIWSDEYELDYQEFIRKHPRGSAGYKKVILVCDWCELVGALYKNKLLNKQLLSDCWSFGKGWERVKGFCLGEREAWNSPELYVNMELLAKEIP
jgi:hypothetical protein